MSTKATPESVMFLRDFLVARIREEHACTDRVFAELKDGNWHPDPKARGALEIASHLATSERWFLRSLGKRKFEDEGERPALASVPQIIAHYNIGLEGDFAAISALTGEQLLEPTEFFGMTLPLYALINFAHVHTIHHRAQLSTYLRPLGGKVPDIYGGSADTPYQP